MDEIPQEEGWGLVLHGKQHCSWSLNPCRQSCVPAWQVAWPRQHEGANMSARRIAAQSRRAGLGGQGHTVRERLDLTQCSGHCATRAPRWHLLLP